MQQDTEKKSVDPRMHSAEHILTAVVMKTLGCDRPFTTHIEKKKSKADYRFDRQLTAQEEHRIQATVNQVIRSDLTVREEFLPREEAARQHNLERLPGDAKDTVRIVHIGDYDACPCIGPHVGHTAEIGEFRIVSTTFENGALRIRFRLQPGALKEEIAP